LAGNADETILRDALAGQARDGFDVRSWRAGDFAQAKVIRVDGTQKKWFDDEYWINAINIRLEEIIQGL
jgi:hypothetical protein